MAHAIVEINNLTELLELRNALSVRICYTQDLIYKAEHGNTYNGTVDELRVKLTALQRLEKQIRGTSWIKT